MSRSGSSWKREFSARTQGRPTVFRVLMADGIAFYSLWPLLLVTPLCILMPYSAPDQPLAWAPVAGAGFLLAIVVWRIAAILIFLRRGRAVQGRVEDIWKGVMIPDRITWSYVMGDETLEGSGSFAIHPVQRGQDVTVIVDPARSDRSRLLDGYLGVPWTRR